MEALDQILSEAGRRRGPPQQHCTLASVQQQSRWEVRRLPTTWERPCPFGCASTQVRHCQKQAEQEWAKRITSRSNILWLQEAVRSGKLSGEDPHGDELFGPGNKAPDEREI